MSNPWFRMYSEFSHDPKVQMMSEAMQRRYVMLMCLRCSNTLVTLQDEEVAFHLRISDADLAETKALFISKGFIDSAWDLPNWDKRQFASDSSKDRVAKHRALLKEKQQGAGNGDVTLQKLKSNALEQNRTDTDTDKKKGTTAAPFVLPEWIPVETWAAFMQTRKKKKAADTDHARDLIVADLTKFHKAGHDIVDILNKSIKGGWTDVYEPKLLPGAQQAAQTSAVWHESAAGVDQKAQELGLDPCGALESRPVFKARVMAAVRTDRPMSFSQLSSMAAKRMQ